MRFLFWKTVLIPILIATLPASSYKVYGQIVINEFLASNSSVNADPDFHEYSDWLELYNSGSLSVNLKGYYVTDNLNNPVKWKIPVDTVIAPGEHVVIWTDGRNTGLHTGYKLARTGEEIGIFSPAGLLLDTLHYKNQKTDVSIGRYPDGSSEWRYFAQPTPGIQNNTKPYQDIVHGRTEFSVTGGLYGSVFTVELSSYTGGTIRYTLDGSEPDEDDPVYLNPVSITGTSVIRARIFKHGMIPGPTVTHTYFLNEHFQSGNLPVISLASDAENFWDTAIGIYVQDFKPEWEIPVNIELFENNGSDRAAFNEMAGAKINGLHAWQLPQKMLGIYFRKSYGTGSLDYPLLFDKTRSSYKTFALRASGSDWSHSLFRDGFIQNLTTLNTGLDHIGFRPCVVYINGRYTGIHNIREKVDEDFIGKNHHLEDGTFDMVENEVYAEAGDLAEYNDFSNLYSQDLSQQAAYDSVAAAMDIENFTDLICTELYCSNSSVNHNVMAWKPKGTGKWKWILNDLDRGFFYPFRSYINYYTGRDVFPFYELMQNQDYLQYFGKRLADHLYTTFNPVRVKKMIDRHRQMIEAEMPEHIERWLGTTSSYGNAIPSTEYWYAGVCNMKTFADMRPLVLLHNLAQYGFSESACLDLKVTPADAGFITFNEMRIPESEWNGHYPRDIQIKLVAESRPGYKFKGWIQTKRTKRTIIAQNSIWRYSDKGLDQGTAWRELTFDDASWSEGQAELGYGDGDENTVLEYGKNITNKHITTYFRKAFNLADSDLIGKSCQVNLLCDDGAVVYINGQEALRTNMGCVAVNYSTLASIDLSSPLESQFILYPVDASLLQEGNNMIAVEVHQVAPASSDISFDLELLTHESHETNIISTVAECQLMLSDDLSLSALYESDGKCIIPQVVGQDMILGKDCSPWVVQEDISIPAGVSLYIEPGVEVWLPPEANISVKGRITAKGSANERITFRLNPDYNDKSWGAICFMDSPDTSYLSYVTIEDASKGAVPVRDVAAISAFKANLVLDNLIIENSDGNPIAGRYSDITLTNSSLHSRITGDLINIKYGKGRIENCIFRGNDQPDTDGIDYDDVENGIIRNSRIYHFYGPNSDAIDIGEKCTSITIDSLLIYDITDKGISAGQQSTAHISHCTFVNCNLGLGLKDSCLVTADHCTFYSNNIAVSCFEKIAGNAGGNAIVTNSIFSNCYEKSCFADNHSTILISNSLSDNDTLPANNSNKFGNPLFNAPNRFNFRLLPGSPCLNAANDNKGYSDLGTYHHPYTGKPHAMFSRIFYNPLGKTDQSEYLAILNPSDMMVDLSGYRITRGITYEFPPDALLYPGEQYILVKNLYFSSWQYTNGKILQWTDGSLSNQGEKIQLTDSHGIVVDQVDYRPYAPWPPASYHLGEVLILKNAELDNHFPESWTTSVYTGINKQNDISPAGSFNIYPNPASGKVCIDMHDHSLPGILEIYDLFGRLVLRIQTDNNKSLNTIDLSGLRSGSYLIRCGDLTQILVLIQ
ncbi:MAG: CotH kinase family protein [Bacteroidales bacterium]|nr:CotH kinase family protein [Bacteroidales bacterium]